MKETKQMQHDKQKKPSILLFYIIALILFSAALVFFIFVDEKKQEQLQQSISNTQKQERIKQVQENKAYEDNLLLDSRDAPIIKENSKVHLAAVGDIMFHSPQIDSAYDAKDKSYNFKPMFKDVKGLLSEADISLANLETTLGGAVRGFSGYPLFNTPDEAADALKDAGIDILTTVNNHSLDTRAEGLKRTATILQEKGFKTVGTYAQEPDSRVLLYEKNDIKFAILAYTESTNGLGESYETSELKAMMNLMTKENIARDIDEAKQLDADFIITFMHWGDEYVREANEKQVEFAHFMAEHGVDLILGSHPHVIQPTDTIETEDHSSFVVYSMGNFISNQRIESLGESFARTEDGVIVHVHIEKNHSTEETSIVS